MLKNIDKNPVLIVSILSLTVGVISTTHFFTNKKTDKIFIGDCVREMGSLDTGEVTHISQNYIEIKVEDTLIVYQRFENHPNDDLNYERLIKAQCTKRQI